MNNLHLGNVESKFVDIIWEHAPLSTNALIKLCSEELNWKRTTTYTVLKKLCERGIFKTENSTVTILITREDFYSMQSEQYVDNAFEGSLPAFLAAFTKRKALSEKDVEEIRKMIDSI